MGDPDHMLDNSPGALQTPLVAVSGKHLVIQIIIDNSEQLRFESSDCLYVPCASKPWKFPGSIIKHCVLAHHLVKPWVLIRNTVFSGNTIEIPKMIQLSIHFKNNTPGSHHPAAQVPGSCLGCLLEVELISLTIQPRCDFKDPYLKALGLKVQCTDFKHIFRLYNTFP